MPVVEVVVQDQVMAALVWVVTVVAELAVLAMLLQLVVQPILVEVGAVVVIPLMVLAELVVVV